MENITQSIIKYLNNKNVTVLHYSNLGSTNTTLKEKVKENAPEGTVIIADSQTEGRGRFYRKFYSPENGIYMSILLRPQLSGFDTTLITTAAAVAVAKAAENLSGRKITIKWVNDVLINGKKICGILTEGAVNPKNGIPEYIIVGIGINAFTPPNGFDDEIKDIAGAVFEGYDTDLKARLTAETINNFMEFYENLAQKDYLKEYRRRSAVIGKEITVFKNCTQFQAKALDIDDNCRLLIEYPDKSQEYLSSGEISIKL